MISTETVFYKTKKDGLSLADIQDAVATTLYGNISRATYVVINSRAQVATYVATVRILNKTADGINRLAG